MAVGGPLMGVVVEALGTPTAMVISGGVPAVVAGVTAVVLARRGQLTLQMRVRRHLPVVEIAAR
jgi:hypothetical protein